MLYSRKMNKAKTCLMALVLCTGAACSKDNKSHTTVVTQVPPPPQQVVTVVNKPVPPTPVPSISDTTADLKKPLLVFHLENGKTFQVGEEVPIEFTILNAKLKGDGGEFRVRYIVDDDELKWLDTAEPFWLAGWLPGEHTIRVELIGPDGWPYKNGNSNIVTREISIT